MQKNMHKSLHRVRFMHEHDDSQEKQAGICFNDITFND